MSRFLLSGYFGFANTGDEAILKSMLNSLKKSFPTAEFIVLSNDPQKTASLYGVRAVNRWRFKEVLAAIHACDCLISGGGSLLQDITGLKSLGYYLGIVRLAKFVGKPVFFYAQGIGPVQSGVGRFLLRSVANKVDYITVRDRQSEIDLQEMGVIKPKITITADPVLLMPPCTEVKHPKMVSVSVRTWQGEEKLHQALAKVCDAFCADGYEVYFIPFQYPADVEPSRKVASLMKHEAHIPEEQLSVDEIACAMAYSEVVIGMRYHALVLAAINGVPFVGIDYDPKVARFLRQTGMPNAGNPKDITTESLQKALRHIYTEPQLKQRMIEKVGELRKMAEKTNQLLIKFMNGEK